MRQGRIVFDRALILNDVLRGRRATKLTSKFSAQMRCLSSSCQQGTGRSLSFRHRQDSPSTISINSPFFVPVASFSTDEQQREGIKLRNHKISAPEHHYLSSSSGQHSRDFLAKQGNHTLLTATQIVLDQRRHLSSDQSAEDSSTPGTEIKKEKRKFKRQRIQVPNYGPDADRAVRSLQNARKERARAKTAANVRRALYGNMFICVSKLGAWISSGSSSMMSEFVHSVVDCGNQALLLMGLRDSRNAADRLHPYGYGKSVYFWALVSALGTFFLGAGVSMSHAVGELLNPSLQDITNEVWAVLVLSFGVDGFVLYKTIADVQESKPRHLSFWKHVSNLRDPATMAVLLEDGAACLGIVIAIAGIGASHLSGMPVFDGAAGIGISCLLGGIGLTLVRVNHRFLLGQGVSKEMTDNIEKLIRSRRSIDNVYRIQSQWTGPETFSFKAEVDFDGTYLAAQLMPRYQGEFRKAREDLDQELEVLLCWYAEDVMRAVEREVRHIEAMIRQKYPGAEYIELEPTSTDADQFAIDDSFEEKLLLIEKEEMQRLVRVLYESNESKSNDGGAIFDDMSSNKINFGREEPKKDEGSSEDKKPKEQ